MDGGGGGHFDDHILSPMWPEGRSVEGKPGWKADPAVRRFGVFSEMKNRHGRWFQTVRGVPMVATEASFVVDPNLKVEQASLTCRPLAQPQQLEAQGKYK